MLRFAFLIVVMFFVCTCTLTTVAQIDDTRGKVSAPNKQTMAPWSNRNLDPSAITPNPLGPAVPCDPACPTGALAEAEVCLDPANDEDVTNGGCNSVPPVYTEISSGDVVCGEVSAGANFRDTDWYHFTITEVPKLATVTLTSETDADSFLIFDFNGVGGCNGLVTAAAASATGDCGPVVYSSVLNVPGEYYVFVSTSGFPTVACGDGQYVVELSIADPPLALNDEAAAATALAQGEFSFSTEGATTDSPETVSGCDQVHNDIHYTYAATCDGDVTISVCDTADFNTKIAVWNVVDPADPPTPGSDVACNDDGGSCLNGTSEVTFAVLAGENYHFVIGGASSGETGSGTVVITNSAAPANDLCRNATPIVAGESVFDTTCAQTDGVNHGFAGCFDFGDELVHSSVWFRYVAPSDGDVTLTTCGLTSVDTALAVFAGDDCSAQPTNVVECADDTAGCSDFTTTLTFTATEGTTYLFEVGGFSDASVGEITLRVIDSSLIVNDDCAQALPIFQGNTAFDTTILSTADGSASCGSMNDIWYRYTPSCDGTATISLDNASGPALLAVYHDMGVCPPTEELVCGDGAPAQFATVAGADYIVQVGATGGAIEGTLQLSHDAAPENDHCTDALPIDLGDTSYSTLCAGTDDVDHSGGCLDEGDEVVHQNIWFEFVAPADATYQVHTCSQADFDTALAIYEGDCSSIGGDTVVGCEDDEPGCVPGLTSYAEFAGTAGMTYVIAVGGFDEDPLASSGTGVVTLNQVGALADNCEDAVSISDGETPYNTENATTDGPNLLGFCDFGPFGSEQAKEDIWFAYEATCDGDLMASNCGAAGHDSRIAIFADDGTCPPVPGQALACNDDCGGNAADADFSSQAFASVSAGNSYLVQVGGFDDGFAGPGTLTLVCSPDNCEDAREISEGQTLFSNVTSTTDGTPGACDPEIESDVWFTFTARMDGVLAIMANGSLADGMFTPFDVGLAAYPRGAACPPTADSALGCGINELSVAVVAGQTVLLQVGGTDGGFGSGSLTLTIEEGGVSFIRGDCNGNATFDGLGDGLTALNFQFVPGTPPPSCLAACDANNNLQFDGLGDGLVILNAQFVPGAPPPDAPWPNCGTEGQGSIDALGCDSPVACP